MAQVRATMDSRYSFTAQFIHGAAIFARHAHEIELAAKASDEMQAQHRAYVVGAIVQSAAALESEIAEIVMHGPGHHLGSNHTDHSARDFLSPMKDIIDRQPPLRKYDLVLHLLRKVALDHGALPYQHAELLFQLRNELTHYKSRWGMQMKGPKSVMSRLQNLRLAKPQFATPNMNFFPHRCLSASLASWCVITGMVFIDEFYKKLTIVSPLANYSGDLKVPPPIRVD
jgi:hypothetical protein